MDLLRYILRGGWMFGKNKDRLGTMDGVAP